MVDGVSFVKNLLEDELQAKLNLAGSVQTPGAGDPFETGVTELSAWVAHIWVVCRFENLSPKPGFLVLCYEKSLVDSKIPTLVARTREGPNTDITQIVSFWNLPNFVSCLEKWDIPAALALWQVRIL